VYVSENTEYKPGIKIREAQSNVVIQEQVVQSWGMTPCSLLGWY